MHVVYILFSHLLAAHAAAHARTDFEAPNSVESLMGFATDLEQVVTTNGGEASLVHTILSNLNELDSIAEAAENGSSAERATAACQVSKFIFGDRVISAGSANYSQEQDVNWSQRCWLPANCFIKPRNAVETAVALKIVTLLGSKFAVRSGGHSTNKGFASIGDEGVLIDMSDVNQVTISADKSHVSVGPGQHWENVYDVLEQQGLTVVGGRVAGVGVGGLLLGGGMSHFSNAWGMACDNVKNYQVVLANSSIVNANKDENSDLFLALKGGGPNYGIVTRYDLNTKTEYQLWYTLKAYSTNDSGRVMDATVQVEAAMDQDDSIGIYLTVTPTALVAIMLYRGYTAERPKVFAPFGSITPVAVPTPETNGTQKSFAVISAQPQIGRRATGSAAIEPDSQLYQKTLLLVQQLAQETPNITFAHTFQPLGAPSVAKSKSLGGNVMNIPPVRQSWSAITAYWTDPALNEKGVEQIQKYVNGIKQAATDAGKALDFDFMNDSNMLQDPLKKYGAASLAVMNAAATRYDPERVFQTLQNNGFLLSKTGALKP